MPVAQPTLEFRQEKAIEQIHEMHAEVLETMTGNATVQERDTWPIKQTAAKAFLAGSIDEEDLIMLETEATLAGIPVAKLAATISYKSQVFKQLVGKAAGLRVAGINAVMTCQSMEQVAMTMSHISNQIDLEIAKFNQAMENS